MLGSHYVLSELRWLVECFIASHAKCRVHLLELKLVLLGLHQMNVRLLVQLVLQEHLSDHILILGWR